MINKRPLFYWCAFSRIYTVSLRLQIAIGWEYKRSVSYLEYKSQQVWTAGKGALEPRMAIEMSQKNGRDKKKNELRPSSQRRCCRSSSSYQLSLPCKPLWDHFSMLIPVICLEEKIFHHWKDYSFSIVSEAASGCWPWMHLKKIPVIFCLSSQKQDVYLSTIDL